MIRCLWTRKDRSALEQEQHGFTGRLHYNIVEAELECISLTLEEAYVVMQALDGCVVRESPDTVRPVWYAVEDEIRFRQTDEKCGVDGRILLGKLMQIGPAGNVALTDAAEQFWIRCGEEDSEQMLRNLGVVR